MVWEDLYCDKVWQFSIFLSCMVLGESYGEPLLRDCSLFMAKGGSVIFNQFRHMKNLPLPESGYLKKLPPVFDFGDGSRHLEAI